MKLNLLLIMFLPAILCIQTNAQVICVGQKIFSEKNCVGDDISVEEKKLHQIINEYRIQNKLSELPLSKPLSIVANRHLIDLKLNLKTFTHSWSDCPYDIKNSKTYYCVDEAPKRLKVDYDGLGFENLYRDLKNSATPIPALEAWKKSELHNSLILNLGNWKNKKWDSLGISINGQYAAIWFGSKNTSDYGKLNRNEKSLDLSFEEVVKNLTSLVSIEKTSNIVDKDTWKGSSKDKRVLIELFGKQDNISQAALSVKIKLDKDRILSAKNKKILLIFMENIISNTKETDSWLEKSFPKINKADGSTLNFVKDGKIIEMRIDKNNYLILSAKPFKKGSAIEIN